ncbi:MAG: FG-GAP repeat domain-containing protein [Phycisphaerales bacterium]
MMRADRIGNGWRGAAWTMGVCACAGMVWASEVPYESDFASGVGNEWSDDASFVLNDGKRVLGRHTNNTVELTLGVTPGERLALVFDLYCIDSWDGDNTRWGPDYFMVMVDGQVVLEETFGVWSTQSYGEWPVVWEKEIGGTTRYKDDVYRNVFIEFTPLGEEVVIGFRGRNLQRLDDESWCLDRVRVLGIADAAAHRPIFREVGRGLGFGVSWTTLMDRGSGMHWADFDGDGYLDCFVTGDRGSCVVRNVGGARFDRVGVRADGQTLIRQGVVVDLNGDGALDIAGVPHDYDMVHGLLNDGSGGFVEMEEPIIPSARNCEAVMAMDLDLDGRPDVLALSGNTANWAAVVSPEAGELPEERRGSDFGFGDAGNGDYVSGADANGDGVLDALYNLSTGLLILSDGNGMWRRNDRGIKYDTHNDRKIGAAWGDYDNDGWFDVFVPDARAGMPGLLFRNVEGRFEDVTASAGVSYPAAQRSAAWGDFDNDGLIDLYVAAIGEPAALFRNLGDGTFERVDDAVANCTTSGKAHHCVWVDFDNDGALDIAITNESMTALLYENLDKNDRYLLVHTDVPGSTIRVFDATGALVGQRIVGNAMGFAGIEPMRAHFGGVDPAASYRVELVTPDGRMARSETVVPSRSRVVMGATMVDQMVDLSAAGTGRRSGRMRISSWTEEEPER